MTKNTKIIDLGSGGGGGWLWLAETLNKDVKGIEVTLTDLFPNREAFNYTQSKSEVIDYLDYPVDARDVPKDLEGVRTQFLSLHHFKPKDATEILQNAVDSRVPIAICEAQERSVPSFLAMFFSPITVLLTTSFIQSFTDSKK